VEFAAMAAYVCAMTKARICRAGALAAALAALALAMPAEAATKAAKPKQPQPAPTAPQPPTEAAHQIGTADSWVAYEAHDKTGRVCYVYGEPKKSEPAGAKRKQPMMMVTHRPEEKIANVVSVMEGYPLKDGSDVVLEVGKTKFELFSKEDSGWARTSELDRTIVGALGKAKQVVVKALPDKGPPTADTYPLAGFAKAMSMIDRACGIRTLGNAQPAPAKALAKAPAKAKHSRPKSP
jgi:hypothetical protein